MIIAGGRGKRAYVQHQGMMKVAIFKNTNKGVRTEGVASLIYLDSFLQPVLLLIGPVYWAYESGLIDSQ